MDDDEFCFAAEFKECWIRNENYAGSFTNGGEEWQANEFDEDMGQERIPIEHSLKRGWAYWRCAAELHRLGGLIRDQNGSPVGLLLFEGSEAHVGDQRTGA